MRQCGDCTLCCKLMPMQERKSPQVARALNAMLEHGMINAAEIGGMVPDFDKPAGQRCQYQKHNKGCAIYAKRPFGCRFWNCRWLVNDDTAELSRPDRSHLVIDIMPDYVTLATESGSTTDVEVVQVWCDPGYRDAHREPHFRHWVERRAAEGKAVIVRFSSADAVTLFAPALSSDREWHEVTGQAVPERDVADVIEHIRRANQSDDVI